MHIFRYSRSWGDTSWPNSSVFREFNFTAGHFIGHNCYIQPSQWLGDLEWNQEPAHEWLHVAESVNANLVNDLDERKDEEKDVNWLYMKTWFGKLNFIFQTCISDSVMQVYEDDSLEYIDSERIRYITPTFNNSSKLEFDIQLGTIKHAYKHFWIHYAWCVTPYSA